MSCGHAGMQRGGSDTCGWCSGGDADRRDMSIAGWRVRIERRCSPPAMPLGRAGHQVEEARPETTMMGFSSSYPRPRPSESPKEAAAPSARRRFVFMSSVSLTAALGYKRLGVGEGTGQKNVTVLRGWRRCSG
eukprot:6858350-Prymnesium_polylepis.1